MLIISYYQFVDQVPQTKPEIVLPQQRKMAIFPPIWVEAATWISNGFATVVEERGNVFIPASEVWYSGFSTWILSGSFAMEKSADISRTTKESSEPLISSNFISSEGI